MGNSKFQGLLLFHVKEKKTLKPYIWLEVTNYNHFEKK